MWQSFLEKGLLIMDEQMDGYWDQSQWPRQLLIIPTLAEGLQENVEAQMAQGPLPFITILN